MSQIQALENRLGHLEDLCRVLQSSSNRKDIGLVIKACLDRLALTSAKLSSYGELISQQKDLTLLMKGSSSVASAANLEYLPASVKEELIVSNCAVIEDTIKKMKAVEALQGYVETHQLQGKEFARVFYVV